MNIMHLRYRLSINDMDVLTVKLEIKVRATIQLVRGLCLSLYNLPCTCMSS